MLPRALSFFDWKARYVKLKGSQKVLTNAGKSDIMNMEKVYSFEEYDANSLLLGKTTPQRNLIDKRR